MEFPAIKQRINHPAGQTGFSLVELSIVLVILGLLVGGILGGQSLIKAAELRHVLQEADTYRLAINNFRLRYHALPGDMDNAVDFWTAASGDKATCESMDKTDVAGTCNGNGDGSIGGDSDTVRPELYLAWQHLQKAELITGRYSGTWAADCGDGTCKSAHRPGINCPNSAKGDTIGWSVYFKNESDGTEGNPNWFVGQYGHILNFGAQHNANAAPNKPALSSQEAWNLDTKLDDGLPAQGNVVVRTGGYSGLQKCTETAAGSGVTTSYNDLDAVYRLDRDDEIDCNLILRNIL